MMTMTILEAKNDITFNDISALIESVGWGANYYQTEEKWQRVLNISSHIAYVKHDERLIAFGRILEDGMMCMFYDICVHPEFQGNSIGKLLMNHLIDKIKDKQYVAIGLFVWEGNESAETFYSKLKFEKVAAMELKTYMREL